MPLPAHPLRPCSKHKSVNDPFCNFEWRVETVEGRLVERGVSRCPRENERIVERCTRCRKEAT